MTYVKINGEQLPATIRGRRADTEWDLRESKAITLAMDYETALATFVDGLEWSIVAVTTVAGEERTEEFDNSEFYVVGPVADNRNGTVTVKMGKKTDGEMLAELMEVLNDEEG